MTKETNPRVMPASHFVAESLEEEANRLPSSEQANTPSGRACTARCQADKADYLRKAAEIYRGIPSSKLVRVWEEKEEFS